MMRGARAGRLRPLLAVAFTAVLILSGCSDDGEDPGEAEGTGEGTGEATTGTTAESEDEPYLPVPDGVELTAQGSGLDVGEAATVAYEPRQEQVAVLQFKVTRLVDASFKQFVGWKLSPETKKTSPYFVHATIENVGDSDVGGRPVPLYAVDGDNKLIEASTFQSTFKPCPQETFPKKFANGDRDKFCMVYLAPDRGKLTAVSFRPTEEFNSITWTGDLEQPDSGKQKAGKKDDGKGQQKGGGGG